MEINDPTRMSDAKSGFLLILGALTGGAGNFAEMIHLYFSIVLQFISMLTFIIYVIINWEKICAWYYKFFPKK